MDSLWFLQDDSRAVHERMSNALREKKKIPPDHMFGRQLGGNLQRGNRYWTIDITRDCSTIDHSNRAANAFLSTCIPPISISHALNRSKIDQLQVLRFSGRIGRYFWKSAAGPRHIIRDEKEDQQDGFSSFVRPRLKRFSSGLDEAGNPTRTELRMCWQGICFPSSKGLEKWEWAIQKWRKTIGNGTSIISPVAGHDFLWRFWRKNECIFKWKMYHPFTTKSLEEKIPSHNSLNNPSENN